MSINDDLLKAISWTLVHSLWQAFLIALLAGIAVLRMKKSTPVVRYNVFVGLFASFLIVSAMTFRYEFHIQKSEEITRLNLPQTAVDLTIKHAIGIDASADLSMLVIDFLNRNANVIVMIWFLIFTVKLFSISRSFGQVYRVRNFKTDDPPQYWIERVQFLSDQMQLKKHIALLASRIVKVPSVTGFFKPMILVPIGIFANLPSDQIEAILLHELAHIKRKDYLVNILQSGAEVVFFFNPSIRWLSNLIRDERENCCDDLAISVTENKTEFVKALLSFETYNMKNPFVMGFGAGKNHLLQRAKRIIHNNNKSLSAVEKTCLSLGLLLILAVGVACSNVNLDQSNLIKSKTEVDSNVEKADQLAAEADLKQIKADALAKKADEQVAKADSAVAEANVQARLADMKAVQANRLAKQADFKMKRAEQIRTQNSETITTTTSENPNSAQQSTVHIRTGITGNNLPKTDVNQLTNNIISDLISDKIIQNRGALSYKLSSQSLVVNNTVQPEIVKNKFCKKYIKSPEVSICYNYVASHKTN